ncbi:MAG TPA: cytochrome c-type biogenesis protein [Alphaproteobacteria bacterium]|nr:cytochrome c-type biogenesis protein [Alphaproteobacteria bacterium]
MAILLLGAALATPAAAVLPSEMLANPVLEARARTISKELRCLVCQNESIDDSNADLAHDLRVLVRQRLVAGDTNAQVIQYIVARYGQFVLLKPPVEPETYALWFGPGAMLLLGAIGVVVYMRRRQAALDAPLSAAEEDRLKRLLDE